MRVIVCLKVVVVDDHTLCSERNGMSRLTIMEYFFFQFIQFHTVPLEQGKLIQPLPSKCSDHGVWSKLRLKLLTLPIIPD